MRLFPVLTAVIVMAVLYLVVLERDRLFEIAGRGGTPDAEPAAAARPDTATDQAPPERKISVVAMRSMASSVRDAVLVRGRTEAARQVDVRAETSGQVISEPLRKGAIVDTGQLLCQLDAGTRRVSLDEARARLQEAQARVPEAEARIPVADARLTEAEARVEEAAINLRAAERLAGQGFASETRLASARAAHESALAALENARAGVAGAQSGVLAARAGVQTAEAAVAAAEKEIERLSITAPFGGLLESDAAETGSLLQPGALCATIIQLDPIKLVGFVPETEIGKVSVGALAGARLATGQQVTGKVTFLSRSADPTTRTFRIEVQVPNADQAISDGQTAEIVVGAAGATAHLVPQSALTLNDDGQLGVRVVDENGVVGFVSVSVLRDATEGIWVAGLPQQADIIVVGQEFVTEGVEVDVAYREPGQ